MNHNLISDHDEKEIVEKRWFDMKTKSVTTDREPFIKELKKQMYPEKKPSKYDYIVFFLVIVILGLVSWFG